MRMILVAALALLAQSCAMFGGGRDFPDPQPVEEAHRVRIIQATVAAGQDIERARKLMKEERVVDSLNLLLDRIKSLQTLLYDEYIVKSGAYDAMDLPTAREYAQLILDLKRAEEGLVKSLNGPLNSILNDLLVRNPDPRRREEAVDAINGGANEIFIQFKTGYREEIVRSFRVRVRTERNVGVRVKLVAVLNKLAVGAAERASMEDDGSTR